ncbi:hypothetical protein BZG36_03636 [Bifiguratus adelaidae]|uniref:Uncharacterized protein n=1 Tax=Bifiguratus adelaidae TaxID=1938954 RepID=A0A261Y055_9FUNG|nr:hypothetical protein BZG36_03636 [Bifiguratus adelaidae]
MEPSLEQVLGPVWEAEWAILSSKEVEGELKELIKPLVEGHYVEVLTSSWAKDILGTDLDESVESLQAFDGGRFWQERIGMTVRPSLNRMAQWAKDEQRSKKCIQVLVLGAAALSAFIQVGWTGPDLGLEAVSLLPPSVRSNKEQFQQFAISALSVDSEDVYHLAPELLFLQLAVACFSGENLEHLSLLKTHAWWASRTRFIQQRILDNPTGTLLSLIREQHALTKSILDNLEHADAEDLRIRFDLEQGLVLSWFEMDKEAIAHYQAAQGHSGLTWTLTGALGRRTKFQTFDVSQLVLMAESKSDDNKTTSTFTSTSTQPETLPLNDDTLLEKIKFTSLNDDKSDDAMDRTQDGEKFPDPNNQGNLKVLDQALLLAFCLNIKRTNPDHGITTEQMVPYVSRVLDNPNNWMVYTMALLLRSRLEAHRTRTAERSVLQLQALVDQIKVEDATAQERLAYFFQILLPSKWELEKELAERLASLGVIRSALEIFERLEMWEEVISCYQMLEQASKAKKVVNDQLALHPDSPKLLCILGDINQDPEQWQKAWQVSGQRYARAMRSLGGYYFKADEFAKSIECYEAALKINPLFENSWFVLGCAAMQVSNWDVGTTAFARAVSLDSDNAEAWNNLASIYIRQDKKIEAFSALKQAVRLKYESWKIWQNFLYVAIDIGEFAEAIRALKMIVDLRWEKVGEKSVDVEVLNLIVSGVIQNYKDIHEKDVARLAKAVQMLLEDVVTARITSSPDIWHTCVRFYLWKGLLTKALEAQQRAYRCVLHNSKLDTDEDVFKAAVNEATELVELLENIGEREEVKVNEDGSTKRELVAKDWKYQTRMILKGLLGRTKQSWEDHELYEKLKDDLQHLKA